VCRKNDRVNRHVHAAHQREADGEDEQWSIAPQHSPPRTQSVEERLMFFMLFRKLLVHAHGSHGESGEQEHSTRYCKRKCRATRLDAPCADGGPEHPTNGKEAFMASVGFLHRHACGLGSVWDQRLARGVTGRVEHGAEHGEDRNQDEAEVAEEFADDKEQHRKAREHV
jgi:hypothetical protein